MDRILKRKELKELGHYWARMGCENWYPVFVFFSSGGDKACVSDPEIEYCEHAQFVGPIAEPVV